MVSHITDEPKRPQNSVEDAAPLNEKVRRKSFQKSAEVGFDGPDDVVTTPTVQNKASKAVTTPRDSRGKVWRPVWPPPSEPSERGKEDDSALSASMSELGSNETQQGISFCSLKNSGRTWGLLASSPASAPGDGKKKVWKPPPKVDEQHLPSHFRKPRQKAVNPESAKWNPNASYSSLDVPEHFVALSNGARKKSVQRPQNSNAIRSPRLNGSPRVLSGKSPIGSEPLPKKAQWPMMHLNPGQKSKEQTRGIPPVSPSVQIRKTEFEQLQNRGIVEVASPESHERRPLTALQKRPSFSEDEDEELKVVPVKPRNTNLEQPHNRGIVDVASPESRERRPLSPLRKRPSFSEDEDEDVDESDTFDDDDEDIQGRAFDDDISSLGSEDDDISSDGSFAGRHRMVDRRTSYRIRYNGPTIPPVPDLDDRFLSSGIRNDGAPSRPNRFVDAAPSRPSRPGSFQDDDSYGENTRPGVWITPMGGTTDADQIWKIKRVWAEENPDEEEYEHNVKNDDLYTKIKHLVGAPHSPKDNLPKIPQRNWNVKKVVETNGEVDESLPEESLHDYEIQQRVEVLAEEARIEQTEREKACEQYKKEKEEYKKEKAALRLEQSLPQPPQSPTKLEEVQSSTPDLRLWWQRDDAKEKEARVHASSSKPTGFRSSAPVDIKIPYSVER